MLMWKATLGILLTNDKHTTMPNFSFHYAFSQRLAAQGNEHRATINGTASCSAAASTTVAVDNTRNESTLSYRCIQKGHIVQCRVNGRIVDTVIACRYYRYCEGYHFVAWFLPISHQVQTRVFTCARGDSVRGAGHCVFDWRLPLLIYQYKERHGYIFKVLWNSLGVLRRRTKIERMLLCRARGLTEFFD